MADPDSPETRNGFDHGPSVAEVRKNDVGSLVAQRFQSVRTGCDGNHVRPTVASRLNIARGIAY